MTMIDLKLIIQEISQDYKMKKKCKMFLFNKICVGLKESREKSEICLPESIIRTVRETRDEKFQDE